MHDLWGQAEKLIGVLDQARASGVALTADIYPYTYWQSGITTLMPPKANVREDRAGWEKALAEMGPVLALPVEWVDPVR